MTTDEMLKLYAEGRNYAEIGALAGLDRKKVSELIRAAGGATRSPSERRLGDKNPAWKGGRYVEPRGYVKVRIVGEDRYEYEHRLVMADQLGRDLTSDEHVHHKKTDEKGNNAPDNLELTTNEKHRAEHHQMTGWALEYEQCRGCGTTALEHRGHGYCARCYPASARGDALPTSPAPARSRWARDYDCCEDCGTTDKPHMGLGLCRSCKAKLWRAEHRATPAQET